MAVLAALSLAITVLYAQRALDSAADVVVRGDGDTLIAAVNVDLWEVEWPLTAERVMSVLAKHEAQGLRYLAVIDRGDHRVIAEAGERTILKPFGLPGDVVRLGRRARLVALVPPPWETRAVPPFVGPWSSVTSPRPLVAVEYAPPLLAQLQADLRGISIVAAVAAFVLVAFALAWSRTATRLSLVQQQAERERRLVDLGRASWVIAHELRNPLAALKGHAQLLVEDLGDPSRAKAVRVVEGAERLERLTSVLLAFVRDAPPDMRAITPAELVDRALSELPTAHVLVDFSDAPETMRADLDRMALALCNLIGNAIQAAGEGADPIEVRVVDVDDREVFVEVRDHGPGLRPGTEARIFDPFVTTKTRGTGLGLSIARRIAEQHSGTLTGQTHKEGGAVFRITIPNDLVEATRP
jgi:signal transduction histidine kinase